MLRRHDTLVAGRMIPTTARIGHEEREEEEEEEPEQLFRRYGYCTEAFTLCDGLNL